jgi:GTP-binding protein
VHDGVGVHVEGRQAHAAVPHVERQAWSFQAVVKAEFVTSAVDAAGFPKERLPEVAFAGRSNVGKSSLINALVRQKVARTSAAPGKTRLANFYRVARDGAPPLYLVDLPGYGYARGGEASKREFEAITRAYFGEREPSPRGTSPAAGGSRHEPGAAPVSGVAGVLLLVDSRHPGLNADHHAWEWLLHLAYERLVVATKVDKLTRSERVRHLKELERLHEGPVLGVSVQTGEGLKELWKTIDALVRPPRPQTLPPPLPNR